MFKLQIVLSHHGCIVHFLYEGLHLWFCWFSVVYHCGLRPIFKSHVVVPAFQYSIVPTDPSNSRLVSKVTFMCGFLEKVVLIQLQYLLLANDIYATYAWNWVAVHLTARMKYWYPDIRRHRLDAVLEGHVWSCKWSVRQWNSPKQWTEEPSMSMTTFVGWGLCVLGKEYDVICIEDCLMIGSQNPYFFDIHVLSNDSCHSVTTGREGAVLSGASLQAKPLRNLMVCPNWGAEWAAQQLCPGY